ncbi:MAG: septation regulator SpoVG [candidate division Zixibacteria bacterium]|nr:septation regulator SpoVG [candidate division Zixibacteria bacterium]
MDITEIRITLRNEEKLRAFANVTFDNAFVVRGLKVINGRKGFFISMPSRRRKDGTHHDIAHPINNNTRKVIEDAVLVAYEKEVKYREENPSAPRNDEQEVFEQQSDDIDYQ